jgi:hypothetical protein
MSRFSDIPLDDIVFLLKTYKQEVNKNIYLTAWNYITTNKNILVPESIADWIIAYNNINNLRPTKLSSIIFGSKDELLSLGIDTISKKRIIRVLTYADKLIDDKEFLNNLPDDVLIKIFEDIDCKTYLDICSISKRFEKLCNKGTLSKILNNTTEFDTTSFNKNELLGLCGMKKYKTSISSYYDSSIYGDYILKIDNGLLYRNNSLIYDKEYFVSIEKTIAYGNKVILLNKEGEVFIYDPAKNPVPDQVLEEKGITQGQMYDNNLCILYNGKVYEYDGRKIELLNNLDNVIKFFINRHLSLFLTNDGTLFTFNSAIKTLEKINNGRPVKFVDFVIKASDILVLDAEGNIYYIEMENDFLNGNIFKFKYQPVPIKNISGIYSTGAYILATNKNNDLYMITKPTGSKYSKNTTLIKVKVKDICGAVSDNTYIIDINNNLKTIVIIGNTTTIENGWNFENLL